MMNDSVCVPGLWRGSDKKGAWSILAALFRVRSCSAGVSGLFLLLGRRVGLCLLSVRLEVYAAHKKVGSRVMPLPSGRPLRPSPVIRHVTGKVFVNTIGDQRETVSSGNLINKIK
ncbi:hypothetical protein N658DRAFT_219785 [Parathielavia hyrcaniae]|uniref:Uncharacterized protein n=1 Tax=Parathielavia hyrcaniae TaxID=113614 RepID=A0AAN6SZG3_9PEZI|nr:hypothetical protein N658DRAFT_219785 [Parathielavia hyrcaniae]